MLKIVVVSCRWNSVYAKAGIMVERPGTAKHTVTLAFQSINEAISRLMHGKWLALHPRTIAGHQRKKMMPDKDFAVLEGSDLCGPKLEMLRAQLIDRTPTVRSNSRRNIGCGNRPCSSACSIRFETAASRLG